MADDNVDDIFEKFGEDCESNNVALAVAIVVKSDESEPLVYLRGDEYNISRLLAHVLRKFKRQILTELSTDDI